MARKPTPATEIVDAQVNPSALAVAGEAMTAQAQEVLALQAHFGLHDVSPDTLVREIKVWTEHAGKAMFEVGMRLCVLRAACPHGEWSEALEKQIGMSPRTAQRFMSAALKCVGKEGPRENILALSRSKVMELVALDDDSLEELETTGRIEQLSLELDAIDCMTVTDLKKALRTAEAEKAAKDKLILAKTKRIADLTDAADRSAAGNEVETAQLNELRDYTLAAEQALNQLLAVVDAVTDAPSSAAAGLAARQTLDYLTQRLDEAAQNRGMALNLVDTVMPASMKAIREAMDADRAGAGG